jgi:hypothetical protein
MLDVRTVLCRAGTCVLLLLLMTYVASQQLRGHRSDPSESYFLCYVREIFFFFSPCWKEQSLSTFVYVRLKLSQQK